jgi:hypothetical protein
MPSKLLFVPLLLVTIPYTWAAGGSIAGRVTDPQGNPIGAARIRLSAVFGTGTMEVTSGLEKRFVFPAVPQGDYEIRARAPGFEEITAPSGIKPPQYFAPGVAGDHGEPIAMFIQVGSYLVPNNLSANRQGKEE